MAERDIREAILVRNIEILTTLAEGTDIKVWRDRAEFDEKLETFPGSRVLKDLPCYTMLDGIETKSMGSSDRRGPQLMLLQPQIFYVPVPTPNPLNEGMGPQLSTFRIKIIKAIMQDGQLQDLVRNNGYIEYRGMETDMQTGAEVKGQFRMDFAFAYLFDFNRI